MKFLHFILSWELWAHWIWIRIQSRSGSEPMTETLNMDRENIPGWSSWGWWHNSWARSPGCRTVWPPSPGSQTGPAAPTVINATVREGRKTESNKTTFVQSDQRKRIKTLVNLRERSKKSMLMVKKQHSRCSRYFYFYSQPFVTFERKS